MVTGVCVALGLIHASPLSVATTTVPVSETAARPTALSGLYAALAVCSAALPERERWRVAWVIHSESQRHGYDPLFVVALAAVESGCSPTARSRHGAVGLIQVKPSTARGMAAAAGLPWLGPQTLTVPAVNVGLGLRYLVHLESQLGDPYVAIAAYNLGPRRAAAMTRATARHTPYVRKVLRRYEALVKAHALAQSSRSGMS